MILWCNICQKRPANYAIKVIGDWVTPKPLDELTAADLIHMDVCGRCFESKVDRIGDGKLEVPQS